MIGISWKCSSTTRSGIVDQCDLRLPLRSCSTESRDEAQPVLAHRGAGDLASHLALQAALEVARDFVGETLQTSSELRVLFSSRHDAERVQQLLRLDELRHLNSP